MSFLRIFILLAISTNLHAEESKIEDLYKSNNINGSILIESTDGKIKQYQRGPISKGSENIKGVRVVDISGQPV